VRNKQNVNSTFRKSFIFLITQQLVKIFKFDFKEFTSVISTSVLKDVLIVRQAFTSIYVALFQAVVIQLQYFKKCFS